jgi:tetratricopeptide (TPR) repeat protein
MERYKWFILLLAISIGLTACTTLDEDMNRFGWTTLSEDMILSEQGFDALSRGNYQEAEEYLDKALALNRINPYALLNMGVVYQNTGRYEEARMMYIRVISQNPDATAIRSTREGSTGKTLAEIAKENLATLPRERQTE